LRSFRELARALRVREDARVAPVLLALSCDVADVEEKGNDLRALEQRFLTT
jgi:hypothetical protein